jgi:hypothetical protein
MSVINITDTASIDSNCVKFSTDPLVHRFVTKADCDSLTTLINSSYHGELSHQGWTNENYTVRNWNAEYIELNVLIQTSELIAYYSRRGYIDTSHHKTFFIQQLKSGGALRYDSERCTMSKCVKKNEKKTL